MLTKDLATEIVEQTMIRLNRNINIMNNKGMILASGNKDRINQLHAGALEVLRTGSPLIISVKDLVQWEGALPGINLPIRFQEQMIGVIGITGDPEELMEFSALVKMITEMMIHQSFIAEQIEWKQRLKEQVFEEMIKEEVNQEKIKQRLNLLNIDMAPPFQVVLIDTDPSLVKKSELLHLFASTFDEEKFLIGFLNVNRIFLLSTSVSETILKQKLLTISKLLNAKNIAARIGIGSSITSLSHIRHSFIESIQALKFGSHNQYLITFSEVETKALLAGLDERSQKQYIDRVLGTLSDKLIETLEHFFIHNQNIGHCAQNMFIHRNSLIYRIKKIKELSGYDPQIMNEAVTLQLAVWLLRMKKQE